MVWFVMWLGCVEGDASLDRADPGREGDAALVVNLTSAGLGESTTDVVHGASGLELDVSSGAYAAEGTWTSRRYPAALISQSNIVLRSTRVNTLVGGDFSDASAIDTLGSVTTPGVWAGPAFFSDSSAVVSTLGPRTFLEFSNPGSYNFVGQYFPTGPGRVYDLSYRLHGTLAPCTSGALTGCEQFGNRLRVYDDDGTGAAGARHDVMVAQDEDGTLGFDTVAVLDVVRHGSENMGTYRSRLAVPDCETYELYSDKHGTVGLQPITPTTSCEDEVEMGHLAFQFFTEDGGVVALDDVRLERVDQIEVSIIDATVGSGGAVLQTSTTDDGFAVGSLGGAVTHVRVQITLRTDRDDASPTVQRMIVNDAIPLEISVDPASTVGFADPRMGVSGGVPPASEWRDSMITTLHSECIDPWTGLADSCWKLLADHGASRWRISGFDLDNLTTSYDAKTGYTMAINTGGEHARTRMMEAVSHGMTPHVILEVNGDYLTDHYGLAHLATLEDAATLLREYAATWVDLLGGDPCDKADTSCLEHGTNYPTVRHWEVFNEPDLDGFAPTWATLDDCEVGALANATANEVLLVDPGADVSTPGLSSGVELDYLTDHLDALDTLFHVTSYHSYPVQSPEDELADHWEIYDGARTAAYTGTSCTPPSGTDPQWEDLPVVVGEFGSYQTMYDPRCDSSGIYTDDISTLAAYPTWSRGFTGTAFARQVARSTLTLLGMPTRQLLYWGAFTPETETAATDPECWHTHNPNNRHIFERVPGSGLLSGTGTDTEYELNEGGIAWLTLAQYASTSSPMDSEVTRVGGRPPAPENRYHSVVLDTPGGVVVVALWWYQPYTFETKRLTDLAHYNYFLGDPDSSPADPGGTYDVGFIDQRFHDVTVTGLGAKSLSAVDLIDLDGTVTDVTADATVLGGDVTIRGVRVGEMPVLLRIHTP